MDAATDQATPATPDTDDGWEWMLVEVLGHRRHTGRVREEERFGAKFVRVDVPVDGDPDAKGWTTHFYAPGSLYGFTPCTRETALAANKPYERPSRVALRGPEDETEEVPGIDRTHPNRDRDMDWAW